ncbi:MAG: hypothetical protein HY329_17725, partial [Chloroflexi bacterium]|nr:hypothetical protein [Chloroflexota bacterium]
MADEIVPRPDDEPQSSASPISNTGDRWSVREQQKPKRRRRVLPLFFVLISLVALLGVTTVAGYYGATRRPVTELPGVATITRSIPPRLLFSFAGVASPVGIAASPDGQRIYVSEGGGERLIKVFNREGRLVDELTAPETKPGQRKPGFLALDTKGRLYASDRIRNTVDVFAPALQAAANPLPASTRWDSAWQPALIAQMGGWVPNGISVGADGRLYVTEIGQNEHSVLVFG